jgi:hypothetical protein
MLFSSDYKASLSLQALFHPCLLKTAMTRIVHGIRMMKVIMLTSSLHHIAPWHTILDHGIPLPGFLSTVSDWSVLDKMALDNAIRGLPVPVIGPAPFGISVHDAIKEKLDDCLLYDIVYNIVYDILCMLYRIQYRIRYTVYDIVHDVVYDIENDIVYISPRV